MPWSRRSRSRPGEPSAGRHARGSRRVPHDAGDACGSTRQDYRESLLLVPGSPRDRGPRRERAPVRDGAVVRRRRRCPEWRGRLRGGRRPSCGSRTTTPRTEDGITENKLRAAGTQYDPELIELYTDVPDGAMGPAANELLDRTSSPGRRSKNPFDLAKTMEAYLPLRPSSITRRTSPDVACDDPSAVECFAPSGSGDCLHYASTMAILLRQARSRATRSRPGWSRGSCRARSSGNHDHRPHPRRARLGRGVLPGQRLDPVRPDGPGRHPHGASRLARRSPPASPQVHLPGSSFEPPDPALGPGAEIARRPAPRTTGGGGPIGPRRPRGDRDLLGLTVFALAFAAWVRGPRGEVSAEAAWKTMARTASAGSGIAPRPTQTVYEYASALGELVPVAERDIEMIATAKVETSYAGVRLAAREARRRAGCDAPAPVSLLRLCSAGRAGAGAADRPRLT